jgi:hypothetical protein
MTPSSKRTFAILIIVLSVIAMAIGFCQVIPYGNVDFPCFGGGGEAHSDTRIVYCISYWPLSAHGGEIYAIGSTNQNEVAVREINLRREGQSLFINNHSLSTDETYETTRWIPSINPWILYTHHFVIRTSGLLTAAELARISEAGAGMLRIDEGLSKSAEGSILTDVIYVSGDVYEGWFINPLGFIILGYGIWLFGQGRRIKKARSGRVGC